MLLYLNELARVRMQEQRLAWSIENIIEIFGYLDTLFAQYAAPRRSPVFPPLKGEKAIDPVVFRQLLLLSLFFANYCYFE